MNFQSRTSTHSKRRTSLMSEPLERREMMTANIGGDLASIPIDEPQSFLGAALSTTPAVSVRNLGTHLGTASDNPGTGNNDPGSNRGHTVPSVLGQAGDTPHNASGIDDFFAYCGNEKFVGIAE